MATLDTLQAAVTTMTASTTSLLDSVNVAKATLDSAVQSAAEQAALATANGAAQVSLAEAQVALAASKVTLAEGQVTLATEQAQLAAAKAVAAAASASASAASASASDAARTAAETAVGNAVAVVTGGTASLQAEPGKLPIADATGRLHASWLTPYLNSATVNHIGIPGTAGFGAGICPQVPAGFTPLPGCTDPASANYGNYQYSDGSIMVWIPAFRMRLGNAADPGYATYGANTVRIVPVSAHPDEPTANAEGSIDLHRAFINGGVAQPGFPRQSHDCSH